MLPSPRPDAEFGVELREAGRRRTERIGGGISGSLALHAVVTALLVFGLPGAAEPPPETATAIPVDLVLLGEKTVAPPAEEKAALPQEKAPEIASVTSPDPVPEAQLPPPTPQAAPQQAKEGPKADPLASVAPPDKPGLPKARRAPRADPLPAVKPPPKPAPPLDDLATRLKSLARQQQQQALAKPTPRQQDDPGASNLDVASNDAVHGAAAAYGVKDFIRAQIERHWYLDLATAGAEDVVVSIHIALNRDGSVGRADIVDDPRHAGDARYRDLALSARNAVLVSSPLSLPPGRYDEVRDMVLTFNPRDVAR